MSGRGRPPGLGLVEGRSPPILGFTGTQRGMTDRQWRVCQDLLKRRLRPVAAHHGQCIGADADFHDLCLTLEIPVTLHPPTNRSKVAWCPGAVEIRRPRPYLERNREIVRACNTLLATPAQDEEQLRSGTWATIRYARKSKRDVVLVFPDGTVRLEAIP